MSARAVPLLTITDERPYPSIPLVGGPFDGQRRPIIENYKFPTIERRVNDTATKIVYDLTFDAHGMEIYKFKGEYPLEIKS